MRSVHYIIFVGAASLVFDLFKIHKGLFLCNYSYTTLGVRLDNHATVRAQAIFYGVKVQSTKAGYSDRYFS